MAAAWLSLVHYQYIKIRGLARKVKKAGLAPSLSVGGREAEDIASPRVFKAVPTNLDKKGQK